MAQAAISQFSSRTCMERCIGIIRTIPPQTRGFRDLGHAQLMAVTVTAAASASLARPSHRATLPRPFGREQDLYEPVKRFLEDLGYEVKGEVRGCDVVAVRRGDDQRRDRAADRGRAQAGLHPRLRAAGHRPARGHRPGLLGGADLAARSPRLLGPRAVLARPPRRAPAVSAPRARPARRPSGVEGRGGTGGGDLRPVSPGRAAPAAQEQGAGGPAAGRARPPPRRPEPGRYYRRQAADDRLPAGGPALRGAPAPARRRALAGGPAARGGRGPERRAHPLPQRLRLVRARGARAVPDHRRRACAGWSCSPADGVAAEAPVP